MIAFIKTIIYVPLYNFLILILGVSWVDAGIAAIILTLVVKIILFPLAKKATMTQIAMKRHEAELTEIKQKYKDRQEQAVKVMEFYKIHNINPFSSILTLLIQIPVIYSLYYIFFRSGLPAVDTNLLYSFIQVPENISMNFLGLLDVSKNSVLLAFLAAISTFVQMHFSPGNSQTTPENSANLSQVMMKQMKYTMPIIVFFISWKISGVVALYWFASNVFGIIQDAIIARSFRYTK